MMTRVKNEKCFRALLIDPERRSIEEVKFAGGSPRQFVGADGLDFFRIADFGATFDEGCVDDVGLERGEAVHAFRFDNREDPIAGRCLIFGARKPTGETCDASMPLAFVREHVEWLGLIKPRVVWEHSGRGSRAIVSYEPAS